MREAMDERELFKRYKSVLTCSKCNSADMFKSDGCGGGNGRLRLKCGLCSTSTSLLKFEPFFKQEGIDINKIPKATNSKLPGRKKRKIGEDFDAEALDLIPATTVTVGASRTVPSLNFNSNDSGRPPNQAPVLSPVLLQNDGATPTRVRTPTNSNLIHSKEKHESHTTSINNTRTAEAQYRDKNQERPERPQTTSPVSNGSRHDATTHTTKNHALRDLNFETDLQPSHNDEWIPVINRNSRRYSPDTSEHSRDPKTPVLNHHESSETIHISPIHATNKKTISLQSIHHLNMFECLRDESDDPVPLISSTLQEVLSEMEKLKSVILEQQKEIELLKKKSEPTLYSTIVQSVLKKPTKTTTIKQSTPPNTTQNPVNPSRPPLQPIESTVTKSVFKMKRPYSPFTRLYFNNAPRNRFGQYRKAMKELGIDTKMIRDISFFNGSVMELVCEEADEQFITAKLQSVGLRRLIGFNPMAPLNLESADAARGQYIERVKRLLAEAEERRKHRLSKFYRLILKDDNWNKLAGRNHAGTLGGFLDNTTARLPPAQPFIQQQLTPLNSHNSNISPNQVNDQSNDLPPCF